MELAEVIGHDSFLVHPTCRVIIRKRLKGESGRVEQWETR